MKTKMQAVKAECTDVDACLRSNIQFSHQSSAALRIVRKHNERSATASWNDGRTPYDAKLFEIRGFADV